jgi:hypothetical protein
MEEWKDGRMEVKSLERIPVSNRTSLIKASIAVIDLEGARSIGVALRDEGFCPQPARRSGPLPQAVAHCPVFHPSNTPFFQVAGIDSG